MKELFVGLVGCGRLAQAGYVPAFAATPAVRLVAVADPDATRARQVADATGTAPAVHREVGELLEAHALDGVVLATPVSAHVADARTAAAAGVPALVEKPPAADAQGAADLARLQPAPALGFNRRFVAGLAEVQEVARAAEGALELELTLHYRRRSWGPHTIRDDALLDLGPHLVDLVWWLSGQEVVAARAMELAHERAIVELLLSNGRATVSCATNRPHRERVSIRSGDRMVADVRDGGLIAGVQKRLRGGGPHPLVASLTAQLAEWAGALAGALAPTLATADDGVAVMTAIDAIRESAAQGGTQVDVVPSVPRSPE